MSSQSIPELSTLLDAYPHVRIHFGQKDDFTKFRTYAPQLVSCFDNAQKDLEQPQLLVFHWKEQPLGVLSFFIEHNQYKTSSLNHYARIDLVIVPQQFEGFGIASVLIYAALVYFLNAHAARLYSISCLAAHPAVAHILETKCGFQPKKEKVDDYTEYALQIDEGQATTYHAEAYQRAEESVMQCAYRIRQDLERFE